MLSWLSGFVLTTPFRWVAGILLAGLIAIYASLWWKADRIEKENLKLINQSLTYSHSISEQKEEIEGLLKKLEECQEINRLQEEAAKRAVADIRKKAEEVSKAARERAEIIREAQHEDACSNVAIPSDVERVLRSGAARANRD